MGQVLVDHLQDGPDKALVVGRELLRVAPHALVFPISAHPARGFRRAKPLWVVLCAQELNGSRKGRRNPKVGGLHALGAELAPVGAGAALPL